jgi:nucleoside-diphosphate-sugar epimerase
MKNILVCGAGGFIGTHLVNRLKEYGNYVIGADIKYPEFSKPQADIFKIGDLRDINFVDGLLYNVDEVYQLAADMGGAGYIFTGQNDTDIVCNSFTINMNILKSCVNNNIKKIFFSSSACVYPEYNQKDYDHPICEESSAYPAQPDSEYGWEKLFSERLYLSFAKNHKIQVRIGRYHNVYGPFGTYNNGKEKVPAALCRKVILSNDKEPINIWGDGNQTRSFLFISDAIDATVKVMDADHSGPFNIGSEELISINKLAQIIIDISNKKNISINNIPGPIGVLGRKSDNKKIFDHIGWSPKISLREGLEKTYKWINQEIQRQKPV